MVLGDRVDADVQAAVLVALVVQLAQQDFVVVVALLERPEGRRLLLQQVVVSIAVGVDVLVVAGVGSVEDDIVLGHRERRSDVLEDAAVGLVGRGVAVEADLVNLDQVLGADVAGVEELVGVCVCGDISGEGEARLLLRDGDISEGTHHHDCVSECECVSGVLARGGEPESGRRQRKEQTGEQK